MNTTEMGTFRDNQNAAAGHDMALMCEYMAHAMKKSSQQVQRMLARLPTDVRKRIRALRKLQLQTTNLEAEFHRLVYDLERKHQESHAELFEKRNGIVNGTYEPTEEECDFPDPVLADEQTLQFLGAQQPATDSASSSVATTGASPGFTPQSPFSAALAPPASATQTADDTQGTATGVPHFWLNIFKYVPMFEMMVKEADEAALKHLADIRVYIKPLPNMSFTLEFCFTENPYFTDAILTKEYLMKCEPEADMPFAFDGPEIHNSRGCVIHWKENMDLTKRIVRHKGGPESGPPKMLKTDTFFNFFDPPVLPEDTNHKDYDSINNRLENDFEIGHYLKERIIPRAVLYYTGENDDDFDTDASSDSTGSEDFEVSEEGEEEHANNGEGTVE